MRRPEGPAVGKLSRIVSRYPARLGQLAQVALLGVAAIVVTGADPPPAMPHPAPNARARPADNAACEGCHAAIAAE